MNDDLAWDRIEMENKWKQNIRGRISVVTSKPCEPCDACKGLGWLCINVDGTNYSVPGPPPPSKNV